ncbi:MAG: amylo-alpha-1,6-glucosidase [bacterium]
MSWARAETDSSPLLNREWLVANGLGGYASATVSGVCTRKYHGLLIAALPARRGRLVMLTNLLEEIAFTDGRVVELGNEERAEGNFWKEGLEEDSSREKPPGENPPSGNHPGGKLHLPGAGFLREFRLESGLPVWRFEVEGLVVEKRVFLSYLHNTVFINYRLISGSRPFRLRLRPFMHFRPIHDEVDTSLQTPYTMKVMRNWIEIRADGDFPSLRLVLHGRENSLNLIGRGFRGVYYRVEHERGYPCLGTLWGPGSLEAAMGNDGDNSGDEVALMASTESWEVMLAQKSREAFRSEIERRQRLLAAAWPQVRSGPASELVLAADQFIVTPGFRIADNAPDLATTDERGRTIMAGYHWFTDWGRDTMISLEGLTLITGRQAEAAYILQSFARHIRHGLIPNVFPEGRSQGEYNTADATLWFFQALSDYLLVSGDQSMLSNLLPLLFEIVNHHLAGTCFGIGVDPGDGLLRQGEAGYQLTWMDAKVGDWVVTPRRGKAVEINALWYNALCLLGQWVTRERGAKEAQPIARLAEWVYDSFNRRFWYEEGNYLYDVVDGEAGDDASLRPNQILAISLPNPVLDPDRWESVLQTVRKELLTPFGLRSLAPGHPDYRQRCCGDIRQRDAAYHQGTVWSWLIGPFIDAWLKVYPDDRSGGRHFLDGLIAHLDDACLGSISEIFDAEPPFNCRGCVSQAWSVAQMLHCWVKTTASGRNTT